MALAFCRPARGASSRVKRPSCSSRSSARTPGARSRRRWAQATAAAGVLLLEAAPVLLGAGPGVDVVGDGHDPGRRGRAARPRRGSARRRAARRVRLLLARGSRPGRGIRSLSTWAPLLSTLLSTWVETAGTPGRRLVAQLVEITATWSRPATVRNGLFHLHTDEVAGSILLRPPKNEAGTRAFLAPPRAPRRVLASRAPRLSELAHHFGVFVPQKGTRAEPRRASSPPTTVCPPRRPAHPRRRASGRPRAPLRPPGARLRRRLRRAVAPRARRGGAPARTPPAPRGDGPRRPSPPRLERRPRPP